MQREQSGSLISLQKVVWGLIPRRADEAELHSRERSQADAGEASRRLLTQDGSGPHPTAGLLPQEPHLRRARASGAERVQGSSSPPQGGGRGRQEAGHRERTGLAEEGAGRMHCFFLIVLKQVLDNMHC